MIESKPCLWVGRGSSSLCLSHLVLLLTPVLIAEKAAQGVAA